MIILTLHDYALMADATEKEIQTEIASVNENAALRALMDACLTAGYTNDEVLALADTIHWHEIEVTDSANGWVVTILVDAEHQPLNPPVTCTLDEWLRQYRCRASA